MNLVLTPSKGREYRAHRETCKKIEGRPTYSPAELAADPDDPPVLPASCCKPKTEDVLDLDEKHGLFVPYEDFPSWAQKGDEVYRTEAKPEPEPEPEDDLDDLIGSADEPTDEQVADYAEGQKLVEEALPPSPAPERKTSGREMEVVHAVANILGIEPVDAPFPGYGKAVKVQGGGSIYLNSKNYADVRATDADTAKGWVADGAAEARGGNYVRISVKGL